MCLADSRQQTTVVMVMAYTVPKRSIPGRAGAIPVPSGSNLSLLRRNGSEGTSRNEYSETMV